LPCINSPTYLLVDSTKSTTNGLHINFITAALDTINKQYKTLETQHTPAMVPGQHSASSIHIQYIHI